MYELARMGVLTAVLFMGQVVLAFLPNVEIVGLLVILYMLFFGKKVFGILFAFVFLEEFFYGFGMWWFSYLYIWNLLALVVLLLPRSDSAFFWSMISGFFGLFFGALCALPCLTIGGGRRRYPVGRQGWALIWCIAREIFRNTQGTAQQIEKFQAERAHAWNFSIWYILLKLA